MFRHLRSDIRARTLEEDYGVSLNTRCDKRLGNLLEERGFDSWSQFLKAYKGKATCHARKRRVFLSFHAGDKRQVQGFRLMIHNANVVLDLSDLGLGEPVHSEKSYYIRRCIREKISRSSVLLCLIGNGTAWRDWVDWEIRTAQMFHKGLCGVKLKGSHAQIPPALIEFESPIVQWGVEEIVAVIECAAARRS